MKKKNNKGFTLVELLAVMVILAIIMVVALPTYSIIYNSVKRSDYLNIVKNVKFAALDYANNAYILDGIKNKYDSFRPVTSDKGSYSRDYNWCESIKISDLIQAGYLISDDDYENKIIDIFTGEAIGYDTEYESMRGDVDEKEYLDNLSRVSVCYNYKDMKLDAFVTKDLVPHQIYHAGDVIRVKEAFKKSAGSPTTYYYYSFKTIDEDFIYDEVSQGKRDEILNRAKTSSCKYIVK